MTNDESAATGQEYPQWLATHRADLARALQAGARVEAAWSWGRLLLFLLAAIVWYPLRRFPEAAVLAVACSAALFVLAVVVHGRIAQRRGVLRARLIVADESARRAGGRQDLIRWNTRPADVSIADAPIAALLPTGPVWRLTEQERDDLDVYSAPVGIFGLLNRASTKIGAVRLRDDLENVRLSPSRILARQAAVKWLSEHHAARLQLLAALQMLRHSDDSLAAFAQAVHKAEPVMNAPLAWLARAWSLAALALVVFGFIQAAQGDIRWALPAVLAILLNIAVLAPFWTRLRQWLTRWELASDFADGYLAVARQASDDLFEASDADLREIHAALASSASADALPAASRWIHWSAGGGMMQIALNAVALYHVHMWERIHAYVAPARERLSRGIAAIAEMESVLSFACFAAEQPGVCWPMVEPNSPLAITQGTHPLITPEHSVPNDLLIAGERNLWLITGSNMSGKSTFLRMIGVNVLLAQAGCATCARAMRLSPMRLMTDLRIRDSIGRGESYFLAEVRQVRRMILPPPDAAPVLGLIDEPFRGTNHQEQQAATLAIIEHLSHVPGLFLIATHDRNVATNLNGAAENFHFQEELGEKELVFDYRLRAGPAVSRNALRVLEKEGYPAELVARANEWAAREQEH